MRFSVGRIFGAILLSWPTALSAESFSICATCAQTLELSEREWNCLLDDLSLYTSIRSDPVFVTLYGCGTEIVVDDENRGTTLDLTMPETSQQNAAEDYVPAFRLSSDQLSCLVNNRPEISRNYPAVFDFRAICSPSAQGTE